MPNDNHNNLIEDVEQINADRGYWFVRTDSGEYFPSFLEHNFIGIGWNDVTKGDIERLSAYELKTKIAQITGITTTGSSGKSKVTTIYNKLIRFYEIKENDIVVIPSRGSGTLAFGLVTDSRMYTEREGRNECEYIKRKKVRWIRTSRLSELDSIFYRIVPSRHAISSIKKYERYIDSVTNTLFYKEGYTHFILNVTREGDIKVEALLNLIQSIQRLSNEINVYFELNEGEDALSIKLNLQSPGKIELKRRIGISVIVLAMIFSSCTHNTSVDPITLEGKSVPEFVNVHQDTISQIDNSIRDLQVRIDSINDNN